MKNSITIKLIGEGIFPEKVSVVDIADIITSFEKALTPMIQDEVNISQETIILSLMGINRGSVALAFHSDLSSVELAFTKISSAIASNNTNILPDAAKESLRNIRNLTKKRNFHVEFCRDDITLAKVTPQTEIAKSKNLYVAGETTLYGTIKRVGGESPSISIELIDGSRLNCKVNKKLAKKLGELLYTRVGLTGIAKWNVVDYSVEEFKITGITEYQETPLLESFSLLSKEIGQHYKDVDPIDFISKFRSNED